MYGKMLALLLAVLMLTLLASCSMAPGTDADAPGADQTAVSGVSCADQAAGDAVAPERASHYKFRTKVCSPLMESEPSGVPARPRRYFLDIDPAIHQDHYYINLH